MRSRKTALFISFLLAALLVCLPNARAASIGYMDVEGETQGRIEGSCTRQQKEGMIEVYSFGHSVDSPRDAASGLPTGKRRHAPFEILKEVDKSSPLLYHALCSNEKLTSVSIKFYRTTHEGAEELYFTVTLENAVIAKIAPSASSFPKETTGLRLMEIISFVYQRIRWTWVDGGIESQDDWEAPTA